MDDIQERLIRLEERQKTLNDQFEVFKTTQKQDTLILIKELEKVSTKIEDQGQRISDLKETVIYNTIAARIGKAVLWLSVVTGFGLLSKFFIGRI